MTGNKPGTLKEVKDYMESWGWTNGGGSNSVKIETGRGIVASHGDPIWTADIEKAASEINRATHPGRRRHGGSN